MKGMTATIAMLALLLAAGSTCAQNVAVGIHSGFAAYIGNTSLGVPAGFNAEWAYDADHSFSGRAHYSIGPRPQDAGFFFISPEYKYHITGESMQGFYIGGYVGFGGGNGSGYFSAGAVTGYSFKVGERFNLEAHIQAGYGNFTKSGVHVAHIVPTFGARYTF
jgi:hypothetical protein